MRFSHSFIIDTANQFRKAAGQNNIYPYPIEQIAKTVLPVLIIGIPGLDFNLIKDWFLSRKISFEPNESNRPLHGFITCICGKGIIFYDSADILEEYRYSIAHEISHFILDHKIPRERAIAELGPSIIEVLDGKRSPTINERIDGILANSTITTYYHLLEKKGDGNFYSVDVFTAESEADLLALELLSPRAKVIKELKKDNPGIRFNLFISLCVSLLRKKYLLPDSVANVYATRLAYMATGGPSIREELGL